MRRTQTFRSKSKRSPVVAAFVVVAIAFFGYSMYQQANDQTAEPEFVSPAESTAPQASTPKPTKTRSRQRATSAPVAESSTPELQVSAQYQCDGRTRCSQMTSCAEAMFFLQNCPGTEMDGDGDGVPCEKQWCGR